MSYSSRILFFSSFDLSFLLVRHTVLLPLGFHLLLFVSRCFFRFDLLVDHLVTVDNYLREFCLRNKPGAGKKESVSKVLLSPHVTCVRFSRAGGVARVCGKLVRMDLALPQHSSRTPV